MKKIILSTLVFTLLLFLLSGLTQLLPWGIPTTQNISAQTVPISDPSVSKLITRLPNELTTQDFDGQFMDQISTYTTDNSFSWIITQPLQKDYSQYFIREALTQLVVAFLLSVLLFLTLQQKLKTRLLIIAVAGAIASVGTYGQLMNWWAMPVAYGIGVSLNLILSWTIVGFISARYIIKQTQASI